MNERELRAALRRAGTVDAAARERSWRVVRAAHAGARPAPRTRRAHRRVSVLVVLALAVLAVGSAAAATAPHSDVGRFVRSVLGVRVGAPHARPALVHVPGGGRLLTQAGGATWVVASDGAKRRLGAYAGATWSPHGLFVAAWRGRTLSAVEPGGRVHWSIARTHSVRVARWGPVDGFRIAYLSGSTLYVVNGDGTGDHRVAAARGDVAPAWRADRAHVVAFVDRRDRVDVVAADTGARLWRTGPLRGVVALAWSPDSRRLAVVGRDRLLLLGAGGTVIASRPAVAGTRLLAAAWSPAGTRLATIRATAQGSEVALLDARLRPDRTLFTGPGSLGPAAWSPDGRWLLVPWPAADQWLFLRPGGGHTRVAAVGGIAAQFTPGAARPRFPETVAWCC
jgi:hypothetical protein